MDRPTKPVLHHRAVFAIFGKGLALLGCTGLL